MHPTAATLALMGFKLCRFKANGYEQRMRGSPDALLYRIKRNEKFPEVGLIAELNHGWSLRVLDLGPARYEIVDWDCLPDSAYASITARMIEVLRAGAFAVP